MHVSPLFLYHSALKFSHLCPFPRAHLYHAFCTTDKAVPCLAAGIHYVLISFKTAIGEIMLAQPTPYRFSSGEYGGSLSIDRLGISAAMSLVCQPAPSITTTAWRPDLVRFAMSSRCWCMMSLLTNGVMMASVSPVAGQTAPKRCTYSNCCCLSALGLLPLGAQSRVVVFCWPNLASS